jgi:hypothetical protein
MQNIEPIKITATATGTAQDTAGYESVAAIVSIGVITDGTHTFTLQESATTTDGDFTNVSASDLMGAFTAADSSSDEAIQWVGYKGSKRYVRVKDTVTGTTTTGGLFSASIVLGDPHNAPTF